MSRALASAAGEGGMFDFDETHRAIAEALRDYCRREIEPLVPRLEAGEASPCDVMRDFAGAFGLDEMIGGPLRGKAARLRGGTRGGGDEKTGASLGDPALFSIFANARNFFF